MRLTFLAAAAAILVFAGILAASGELRAGTAGAAAIIMPLPAAAPLLHKADIYRTCVPVRHCWYGDNRRRRCGEVVRCRECRYQRECTGAAGCHWREVCRWGPYRKPVQQPLPPPQ